MSVLLQLATLALICLLGELIAVLLPFTFPASILSMLLLLALLFTKKLRPEHFLASSTFLLDNMTLFFIPACVGIIQYSDVLFENLLPMLLICAGTVPLIIFVTGHTVQITMRLLNKEEKHV